MKKLFILMLLSLMIASCGGAGMNAGDNDITEDDGLTHIGNPPAPEPLPEDTSFKVKYSKGDAMVSGDLSKVAADIGITRDCEVTATAIKTSLKYIASRNIGSGDDFYLSLPAEDSYSVIVSCADQPVAQVALPALKTRMIPFDNVTGAPTDGFMSFDGTVPRTTEVVVFDMGSVKKDESDDAITWCGDAINNVTNIVPEKMSDDLTWLGFKPGSICHPELRFKAPLQTEAKLPSSIQTFMAMP